jgi:hypothetical protein
MFFWAAVAAVAIVCVIALVLRQRRVHDKDALEYEDFVELGRAAWIDLRNEDSSRLSG